MLDVNNLANQAVPRTVWIKGSTRWWSTSTTLTENAVSQPILGGDQDLNLGAWIQNAMEEGIINSNLSNVYGTNGTLTSNRTIANDGYNFVVSGTGNFVVSGAAGASLTDTTGNQILVNSTGVTVNTSSTNDNIVFDAGDGVARFLSPARLMNVTTTEKNALTASSGDMVVDTTLNKLCVYVDGAWETVTSS